MFDSGTSSDAESGATACPPDLPPGWLVDLPDPGDDDWLRWSSGPVVWPEQAERLATLTVADIPPLEMSPADVPVADRAPSGWLALELDNDTADPTLLSDAELIDSLVAWEHLASWAVARQTRVLAEFARRRPGDDPQAVTARHASVASPWAPDELGLALTLSRGTAMNRLGQAGRFADTLAATLDLLEVGRLDVAKARAICDTTAFFDADLARAVQDRVLPKAPDQTLAQLRAALARALIAVDPRGAAERHRAARRQRHVRLTERDDGMASLWALLSAPEAVASYQWLTRLARSLGADDPRDMDTRRADLLTALLTGHLELHDTADDPDDPAPEDAHPDLATATDAATAADTETDLATSTAGAGIDPDIDGGPASADADFVGEAPVGAAPDRRPSGDPPAGDVVPAGPPADVPATEGGLARGPARRGAGPRPAPAGKPLVHVTIPYSTLIGADDQPCELAGYGPIPADLAREIAADGVWKRLVADPLSGALLDHGRTTYRPPAALADFVRARDGGCRSPICRRQADNCELDHAIPWSEGGETAESNLWTGCVHDHHLKHQPGWTVRMIDDGVIEWVTPTGHRYVSNAHDYRPAHDPDPPLLRRVAGKDPVPEHLSPDAVFGRPGHRDRLDRDEPTPF